MATDSEKLLKDADKFLFTMERVHKTSKDIAANWAELFLQMERTKWPMMEQLLGNIRTGVLGKAVSQAFLTSDLGAKGVEKLEKKVNALIAERINLMTEALILQNEGNAAGARAMKTRADALIEEMDDGKALLAEHKKFLPMAEALENITGKRLSFESLFIRGFKEAIARSGEMNRSLIDANSELSERRDLVDKVWQTMSVTGASQQEINEAAKALIPVWKGFHTNFNDTLQVMVEMKEGLGVSYENSAQLARVFETNLKTPVREVADQITAIKNSTSLAADEATRFAVEIGKSLRLLGPGAIQGSAAKVTGYVTMMAGRMKDVGGDAEDVVKLFSEMTKGTEQGIRLRGMVGVGSPGQVGTQPGADAAFAGVQRLINTLVRSAPGTTLYTQQVETASQKLGISALAVEYWYKMIAKSNEPLSENQKLQDAWRAQMELSNGAFAQVKDSIIALIQRGFTPLLPLVQGTMNIIARFVNGIAENEATAVIAIGAVFFGLGKFIWTLGRLTKKLWEASAASEFFGRTKGLSPGGLPGSLGNAPSVGMAKLLGFYLTKPLGLIAKVMGPSGLAAGIAGAVAVSATVGWSVGRMIDKKWPDNWIHRVASETAGETQKAAQTHNALLVRSKVQDMSASQFAANIRQAYYRGGAAGAQEYFNQQSYRVKGLETGAGVAGLKERAAEAIKEAQARMDTLNVTPNAKEAKERDERDSEAQQMLVKLAQNELTFVQDVQRKRVQEAAKIEAQLKKEGLLQLVRPDLSVDPIQEMKKPFQGMERAFSYPPR